ncbi:ABC transporter ATP-binding protein [Luteimonas sp. S4-F44]|uniref:ABC transporter ATP-binding protein n=1 Tax=Luteimonas sp. S4-F44 TaxID=2925842 RepID=UPI001F53CBC6|nr:ABC transporter ATP-binding protein [Luteimonas sp. S4-F44]UNK44064.1 ABC transporter ATP-binding protein [Luteimonas sp. S4-F44]
MPAIAHAPTTATVEPLARLRGVVRTRGRVRVLDGVDLAVPPGQVTALLGVNGAGKSTTLDVLLGLQPADRGETRLFGRPPADPVARRRIGVMLQQAQLPERLQVGELLALVRSWYPAPHSMADCVALAGLEGLLSRRYGRLSGGQQRRVQFALALCGRPQLLFLDEPTTGLDHDARRQVWQAVRALVTSGAGVLLTTHDLAEAEALADRVVVLAAGRVCVAGSVDAVRARVAQRRVACDSALPEGAIATWPGVASVTRTGDRLTIVADDADALVRRLLQAGGLEVRRADLAEALTAVPGQARTGAQA